MVDYHDSIEFVTQFTILSIGREFSKILFCPFKRVQKAQIYHTLTKLKRHQLQKRRIMGYSNLNSEDIFFSYFIFNNISAIFW